MIAIPTDADLMRQALDLAGAAAADGDVPVGAVVVDAAGSHSIYVSQPEAVADLIKQAASA